LTEKYYSATSVLRQVHQWAFTPFQMAINDKIRCRLEIASLSLPSARGNRTVTRSVTALLPTISYTPLRHTIFSNWKGDDMNDTANHVGGSCHRPGIRLRRARNTLAVLIIGFALVAVICSCSLPGSGAANGGQPSTPGSSPSSGSRSTSGVTVAFAECMRSHGMPNFPNPTGNGPELGPGSGIDPTSPQFQKALQACKSLAPPAWVSSGPSSGAP
jgi:hypothetical protein